MSGAFSATVNCKLVVELPAEFVAVIVYVAAEVTRVGVPVIRPLCASMERPRGSEGDTDQVGKVPLVIGISVEIVESRVKL